MRDLDTEAGGSQRRECRREPPVSVPARGAGLTPTAVKALQRTVGNRAVARLVAAGRRPPGRVLQRVILQMRSPSDRAAETHELERSVELLQRKDRGSVHRVDGPDDFPDLTTIAPTETVYLLSHSEGVKIGGLTPRELAAKLVTALPVGYRGKIVLVACHSADEKPNPAIKGPLAKLGPMSYARYLAYFLNDQLGQPPRRLAIREVQGRVGISTLDPVTGGRRSLPEEASGETTRRISAWSAPHEAKVKRLHDKLTEVKDDAERQRRWALAGTIFEARTALKEEWNRAWEHKLSLMQLDVGARTRRASTVGYLVAPTAPRIDRPLPPPATASASAHERIDQRLTDHLAELDTLVADLVLQFNAGEYDQVRTLAADLVSRIQGWAGAWAGSAAGGSGSGAGATAAGAEGAAPQPTIVVETMVVDVPRSSSTADPPAATSATDA